MMVSLMLPLSCAKDTETDTGYKEVSVSTMTLSIPTEWQIAEELDEFDLVGWELCTLLQYYQFDSYKPSTEDCVLIPMVLEVHEYVEEWEDMTGEDYLALTFGWLNMLDLEGKEITQTITLDHTIYDNYAIEVQLECRIEGEPSIVNTLLVFAENDLGVVTFLGEGASCIEYKDVWCTIRDSVKFSYEDIIAINKMRRWLAPFLN